MEKVGDWALAHRILNGGGLRVRRAIDRAVVQEAQSLRSKIIEGLVSQEPGGQAFKPLAESTLAARRYKGFRGTKALLNRGDLRNSIAVHREHFGAFVGVLRTARNRNGASLANVAELNEWGSRPIVIQVTPKMRKFLAALHRTSGGTAFTGGGGQAGGGASGFGVIVMQIPARPFIRPVVEKYYSNQEEVRARFMARVGLLLGGDFGGPGVLGSGNGGRPGSATSGRRGRSRGRGGGGIISFLSRLFRGGGGSGGPERDPRTGRFLSRS